MAVSCCLLIEQQSRDVYVTGCRWQLLAWLENNLDIIGATALAFAILHVCCILFHYNRKKQNIL